MADKQIPRQPSGDPPPPPPPPPPPSMLRQEYTQTSQSIFDAAKNIYFETQHKVGEIEAAIKRQGFSSVDSVANHLTLAKNFLKEADNDLGQIRNLFETISAKIQTETEQSIKDIINAQNRYFRNLKIKAKAAEQEAKLAQAAELAQEAKEQAAKEQAAKEQEVKEQEAKEQAAKEQAIQLSDEKSPVSPPPPPPPPSMLRQDYTQISQSIFDAARGKYIETRHIVEEIKTVIESQGFSSVNSVATHLNLAKELLKEAANNLGQIRDLFETISTENQTETEQSIKDIINTQYVFFQDLTENAEDAEQEAKAAELNVSQINLSDEKLSLESAQGPEPTPEDESRKKKKLFLLGACSLFAISVIASIGFYLFYLKRRKDMETIDEMKKLRKNAIFTQCIITLGFCFFDLLWLYCVEDDKILIFISIFTLILSALTSVFIYFISGWTYTF